MRRSMQSVLAAAIMVVLAVTTVHCSLTACPVNTQQFLSIDRDLLPLTNVRATSEDSGFNDVADLITSAPQNNPPWCSAGDTPNVEGHYVEVNFTEPVVLTLVESSGYANGYVSNFAIEYGMLEGDLQPYTMNGIAQNFQVGNVLLSNTYFTLGQPIVAQRMRFLINNAFLDPLNRICWELVLYGCKLSEGIEVDMQTLQSPTAPTTTQPDVSCTPAETDSIKGTQETVVLVIALPIALATVLMVTMITITGVIVCVRCSGREKQNKDGTTFTDSVTVHMVSDQTKTDMSRVSGSDTPRSTTMSFLYDNPRPLCYDVPRASMKSRHGSEVGSSDLLAGTFEIKNPLYSLKRKHSRQEAQEVFVSDGGNDYEMIPDRVVPSAHSTRHTSLPPTVERSPDPPPSLPVRTHTYSLVKKRSKNTCSFHGSIQDVRRKESKERINESIYNTLSKVAGSDPMFQVVYDEPCNDPERDMDKDIDTSVV